MDATSLRKVSGSKKPKASSRYTLAQLLVDSDYSWPITPENREWIDAPPVGRELL